MSGKQDSNLRALASKASEINLTPLLPELFVTPERIELPPHGPKPCVLTVIRRGNKEEGVGLEPTTVLPATTFQEWLLIQPDTFHLILSNMSMNSFVEQAGFEPATIPYLSPAGYLEDSNLISQCLERFTIYHSPLFFISIPKDMIFFSIRQLFFNFFLIKNPNLFFDPGTLLIICILYYIISYLGTSLFRFVIIRKAKNNIPT